MHHGWRVPCYCLLLHLVQTPVVLHCDWGQGSLEISAVLDCQHACLSSDPFSTTGKTCGVMPTICVCMKSIFSIFDTFAFFDTFRLMRDLFLSHDIMGCCTGQPGIILGFSLK